MKVSRGLLVLCAVLVVSGCETLRGLLAVQRPRVRLESLAVSRLGFEEIELTALLAVENPNPVGVSLAGFGYRLDLAGNRFVSGDQTEGVEIAAGGVSRLTVPVALGYREILQTVAAARDADELPYRLAFDLRFDVPGLGRISVPLEGEGMVPVLRLPTLRVDSLALTSLSLTGAELTLTLEIANPNGVAFSLDRLEYAFAVQERDWVDGVTTRAQRIAARSAGTVTLPFRLSFISIGQSARALLTGDQAISYRLAAAAVVKPDFDLVPPTELPFAVSGSIPLRR